MKKRLRKKKHLGEFRQMGFSVECRFRPGWSSAEFDQFLDEFIEHAIEAHGLMFGGGGSPERGLDGVVSRDNRYDSTTDEDKNAVNGWLKGRMEVASYRLSEFWDVWHGRDPFETEIAEPIGAAKGSALDGSGSSQPSSGAGSDG